MTQEKLAKRKEDVQDALPREYREVRLSNSRDDNVPLGLLALRVSDDLRIIPQCDVNQATLVGIHRSEGYLPASLLGSCSGGACNVHELALAAALVALDVNNNGIVELNLAAQKRGEDHLKSVEGAAVTPDEDSKVTTVRFGLRELGYECGKQLIAEGRRNLVFLPTAPPWSAPLAGIRKAYEEAGIPLNENLFLENMQTCLGDLRKLLSFGVPVDAVFNSLYQQNEVADILREFHIDLQNQCRLIESDLCISGDKPFSGYVYHFEFQKHARNIAALLKRALKGEELPPGEVITSLRLESRGLPDCRS